MGKRGGGIRKRIMDEPTEPKPSEPGSSSSSRSIRARVSVSLEAGPSDPAFVGPLPLVDSLRHDWAKGEISAVQVQRYAMGATQQSAGHVAALAAAGSSGKHA